MSSFENDENIRAPDEVYRERLVSYDENEVENIDINNNDINIALQKSLEEYIKENDNHINQMEDEEYEKIIEESILEEEKRLIEEYEKEYKLKYDELVAKKNEQYKYILSKITYIVKDENKRNIIINIIKKYIQLSIDEKYIYISNDEYILFNKFMNYIYNIPLYQNRRIPINKIDAEELIENIKNIENETEYVDIINEKIIKEINDYFN